MIASGHGGVGAHHTYNSADTGGRLTDLILSCAAILVCIIGFWISRIARNRHAYCHRASSVEQALASDELAFCPRAVGTAKVAWCHNDEFRRRTKLVVALLCSTCGCIVALFTLHVTAPFHHDQLLF